MKPRERADAPAVTARPRSLRSASGEGIEQGLSIDPEQMGQSFLRYATQQGADEGEALPELQANGASASDGAERGSHFSVDASIWENTANEVLEHGGIDALTGEAVPPVVADEAEAPPQPERGVLEVDLMESVIQEASLLDEESSVLGETVPKRSRTDDTGPTRPTQGDEGD